MDERDDRRVRALELDVLSPRAALALVAGRLRPELRRGGTASPLRLVRREPAERPPGWVRVHPTLSGICASDHKFLSLTGWGTTLMAYSGVPRRIVPGHEIVGVVVEADADAHVQPGDRVVCEPTVTCEDRGFRPCSSCVAGDDHLCIRLPEGGPHAPGQGFGHNARYGGGWSEDLVAPARRTFRVPEGLPDRCAVLAEPMAVAVHAVARNLPDPGARVLVIGPGSIGLCLVLALRHLAPDVHVTVAGLGHFADALARRAGAHILIHGTRQRLVEAAGQVLDTPVQGGRLSGPVLASGFDVIYDVVGSEQTLDDAFRMTRPGGRVVLVATSIEQEVDWSLVWWRELSVAGTVYYADEAVTQRATLPMGRRRAMRIALEILELARPEHLVTHTFGLERSVEALTTAASGPGAGALKVTFDPSPPHGRRERERDG